MTWSEEVALIFLQVLYDPELILYLLSVAKPIHFKYLIDEAKLFHESLRISREQRWTKTKELSKQRKFNQMNSLVPVTTTLPFDNGMWLKSCKLLESIRYMRHGFLRRKFPTRENYAEDVELELPLKIKCINLLSEDSIAGYEFRGDYSIKTIKESLDDLDMAQEIDMFQDETPYRELPYLLIEIWCDGICPGGYNDRRYKFKDNITLYIQEIIN